MDHLSVLQFYVSMYVDNPYMRRTENTRTECSPAYNREYMYTVTELKPITRDVSITINQLHSSSSILANHPSRFEGKLL